MEIVIIILLVIHIILQALKLGRADRIMGNRENQEYRANKREDGELVLHKKQIDTYEVAQEKMIFELRQMQSQAAKEISKEVATE